MYKKYNNRNKKKKYTKLNIKNVDSYYAYPLRRYTILVVCTFHIFKAEEYSITATIIKLQSDANT